MNKMDQISEFCKNHSISIVSTNKRSLKMNQLHLQHFINEKDYNVVSEKLNFDTERLYTVEIPESDLEKLAMFESQIFNNMKRHGHYNLFVAMIQQKELEQEYRKKYQAVAKAYEHYSLLLKMASEGQLDA